MKNINLNIWDPLVGILRYYGHGNYQLWSSSFENAFSYATGGGANQVPRIEVNKLKWRFLRLLNLLGFIEVRRKSGLEWSVNQPYFLKSPSGTMLIGAHVDRLMGVERGLKFSEHEYEVYCVDNSISDHCKVRVAILDTDYPAEQLGLPLVSFPVQTLFPRLPRMGVVAGALAERKSYPPDAYEGIEIFDFSERTWFPVSGTDLFSVGLFRWQQESFFSGQRTENYFVRGKDSNIYSISSEDWLYPLAAHLTGNSLGFCCDVARGRIKVTPGGFLPTLIERTLFGLSFSQPVFESGMFVYDKIPQVVGSNLVGLYPELFIEGGLK